MTPVIVDYGMGNLGSILNMLKHVGVDSMISAEPAEIEAAGKLILPGVGAFDNGMKNLAERGLVPLLRQRVDAGVPILGICLGAQLLFERSEEGVLPGLGWIRGQVTRFAFPEGERRLKVPHMGWNVVESRQPSPLFEGASGEQRFYFVHSYYMSCADERDVLSTTPYGQTFVSGVQRGNVYGVQFHPEKSHKFGMRLLKNFAELG
jgi:glutamine amidotransferase